MSTKFVEILGNFQRKVLKKKFLGISWELFPRFSQEFLSTFINQDLGPIVVNILATMLPLQLSKSITIFLRQNGIVVLDLTEVVM